MDLIYLTIIWFGVLCSSWLAEKTKLTATLFFLAFGCLFVNLGILPEESTPFLDGFSEIGIVIIMFALGFEESTTNFLSSIKRSWGIAFFGALAPFFTAYSLTLLFWDDTNIALICGLAMTATAVSLTMVSLKSEGMHRTAAATGIMTSAVLDDVAALAFVAVLIPIASGTEQLSIEMIFLVIGKSLVFFALVTLIGTFLFPKHTKIFGIELPFLSKLGIKDLLGTQQGSKGTLIVLLLALLIGLIGHYFGFHPAIGAYMAGLILREEYFQLRDKPNIQYYEDVKTIIDDVAYSWIGPVFFIVLGSKLIIETDIFVSLIPQTIILTSCLIVTQISSAALAARFTGNFHWHESIMIGLGMLGRAELAFIVMNIAYVDYSILSREAFYTLMFTAFWLNVAVPISIHLYKPRYETADALVNRDSDYSI
ncbi:MAG: cation:proton antiporter [Pseudomonadales bacterium]|nr:cation:proton antiporter [Pseudomonadales bacterium]